MSFSLIFHKLIPNFSHQCPEISCSHYTELLTEENEYGEGARIGVKHGVRGDEGVNDEYTQQAFKIVREKKNFSSLEFIKINVLDKHNINISSFWRKENLLCRDRMSAKKAEERMWRENKAIDKLSWLFHSLNVDVFLSFAYRTSQLENEQMNIQHSMMMKKEEGSLSFVCALRLFDWLQHNGTSFNEWVLSKGWWREITEFQAAANWWLYVSIIS